MESYELTIAGVKRELPIIAIDDHLKIASFVILGDTELIAAAAPVLAKKLPEVDILFTAEAKGIPLVYELSKQLHMKQYIVARKSVKPYMDHPLIHKVVSITTQKEQVLCLDANDAAMLKGKKVALIDDVISTGESMKGLEELAAAAGAKVVAKAALLAEGDAEKRSDIIYLEKLPVFKE
ncbi:MULTISPECIES: phosphoribosyltransferase family protein [Heyndrickxia]|jgi:adenine phosphoribosyltransferase|uniref:Adenine phosphoribosyltransferase n=1 Tax=Heyndrickxia coagulans TaxID=1398 RepID=A0A150K4M1_HEYCO|nr:MULTISPECIES: phosphoribosyltransferase family protein [Heyndrickxia]KYC64509.1 Adenine phosphoribosyltransferase [Heyndrickxia coagulans]